MHLLAAEGITDELWSAFLVYLTATGRPAAELFDPHRLPLSSSFVESFAGMTEESVDVHVLEQARENLIAALHARVDDNVRAFLTSVEFESPQWNLLDVPAHVAELPAIRWKLLNLRKRSTSKRAADHHQLAATLERIDLPRIS